VTPVELARAEIARRRELAKAANTDRARTPYGDTRIPPVPPEAWGSLIDNYLGGPVGGHCAVNDPAHVLAVLAAADAALDRHTGWHWCIPRPGAPAYRADTETCTEAQAVLDLYAPQETT
jgi:hypothetical protein